MKKGFVLLCVAASNLFFAANAQTGNDQQVWGQWQGKYAPAKGEIVLQPSSYKIVTLNQEAIKQMLASVKTSNSTALIQLPTPEGTQIQFNITSNGLLPKSLQERYPDIMTFTGVAISDNNIVTRIDYTSHGFHAMVMDGDNTYFIDPYSNVADGYYTVYYKKDFERADALYMACEQSDEEQNITQGERASLEHRLPSIQHKSFGATRKTYRLALSCTGEYAQAVDGPTPTKAGVLAAMTTTMNRVNGIYEKEVAVTMEFIDNVDTLIYLSGSTDPFTANFNGLLLLEQNQDNTDAIIDDADYDLGHIFSTGGGGVAILGSVCTNGDKAQGVTGSPSPVGDPYDVDYVSHEMGHQFGAEHTFNRCSGTESWSSAYEPGSGSTIMAYAGICGSTNNLQINSNAYFHAHSLDEISDFLTSTFPGFGGGTCGVATTGAAIVSLPAIASTYQIPYQTPFELSGAPATAGAAGTITYAWEQWNLGDFRVSEPDGASFVDGPSFRSFTPDSTTTRVFPRIDSIVRNIAAYRGERLPTVARELRFKLTAREVGADGWGTFHVSEDEVTINVNNTGTPFSVSNPSVAGIRWKRGTTQTVNWEVANTNIAPISTSLVDIYLSTDGGYTYPVTLATGVPNTGSAGVTVPADITTTTARIKVKGNNNIFFDISNNNFEIGDTTILSIADAAFDNSVEIYPNPAQNTVQIAVEADYRIMMGAMYNSVGQKVWEGKIENNTQIEVGTLARGLYFIHLLDTEKGAKLVKRIALQ